MKRLSNARSLTAISVMAILLCAVVPAMATSYPYSGTYNVSGSLDNQYFGGSIVWTGTKITSYNLSFGGQSFSCSWSGFCGLFLKSFKFDGSNALLAGFFGPNNSPFTLTMKGKGWKQTYWTNLSWTCVAVPEESVVVQVGCLLALFAFVIPRSRLLRHKA